MALGRSSFQSLGLGNLNTEKLNYPAPGCAGITSSCRQTEALDFNTQRTYAPENLAVTSGE